MKLNPIIYFTALILSFVNTYGSWALKSPDENVSARVVISEQGNLLYNVGFGTAVVVEPSVLGVTVEKVDLGQGVDVELIGQELIDDTYVIRGNDAKAHNHYNEYPFSVTHVATGREYSLEFRLYNDGAAYRYIIPGEGTQHVNGERSSWTIMPGAKTWYFERLRGKWKLMSYAGVWESIAIEDLHNASPARLGPVQGTPLVFELPDDLGYAAVTKAATYNYSGMRLEAVGERTVVANFTEGDAGFHVEGDIVTPWRVTLLADDLNELVNSDLINNLNPAPDPELFADTSYIKLGRSAWSWETLGLGTPEDQLQYIRYAAELGFEYSTVDDGWKDWEDPWGTMKMLCDYGRERGVGIFLWVDSKDINDPTNDYQQMREYFDRVVTVGSVGLKIDFMNAESKDKIDFEIAVLQNSAKRRLLINFHGCHSSTGEERTYPNEVTREGIRGIEVNKHQDGQLPPSHNAALPFTRFVVGQADYTPILYTNPGPTTWAHQLATMVPFTSALQTVAEYPEIFLNHPIIKQSLPVLKAIPPVWDETIVLPESKIADLAAFARRDGNVWIVGILNGSDARDYSLALDFLEEGTYEAEIVSDDLNAERVDVRTIGRNDKAVGYHKEYTHAVPFKVHKQTVNRSQTLNVQMADGGGYVAVFRKKPNVVWIMAEDIGVDLECYGMPGVQTPNLNKLAAEGALYQRAYVLNPICSPNRSSMMVGVHPTTIDVQHHRSNVDVPLKAPYVPMTKLLSDAGYTNIMGHDLAMKMGVKTDCNFKSELVGEFDGVTQFGLFDKKASFSKADQPFFNQITLKATHRGDWWSDIREASEDPVALEDVVLPPYYADTPEIRYDWATYLDTIEYMDNEVGQLMQDLKDKGLAENTIVIFIGDNGRCNIRGKGYLYEAGIRVPMIVWAPGLIEPGTVIDELVTTTDITASILNLAGAEIPDYITAQPVIGADAPDYRRYIRSSRDIWGEIDECSRSITTKQFKYIKNYMPEVPWAVNHAYSELNRPALHVMRRLKAEGKLSAAEMTYFHDTKPDEELYDLSADPYEMDNLAEDPEYAEVLNEMRAHEADWQANHHDHGLADLGKRTPTVGSTVRVRANVKRDAPELWQRLESGELMKTQQWMKQFK